MNHPNVSKTDLIEALELLQSTADFDSVHDQLQRALQELGVHQLELEMQNRELQETRAELEASRNRYADLYDFAPIGYLTMDEAGVIRDINLTGCGMLREDRAALLGRPFRLCLDRSTYTAFRDHLRLCRSATGKISTEVVLAAPDGASTVHVELQSVCMVEDGWSLCRTAMLDINERKRAEAILHEARVELEARVRERTAQLQASLQEKDALLKEIHHRVKNNLQVIISLLSLHAGKIKDAEALQVFRESKRRVRAMALIHEELYRFTDLARINMGPFLNNLTSHLRRLYLGAAQTVRLETRVDDVELDADRAIPCGLLISELVSNSLKHAFPAVFKEARGDRHKQICVDLHVGDDRQAVLSIADNGVGLPDGFDIHGATTLGLQLVNTFAEQLRGTLDCRCHQGTSFTVTFAASKQQGKQHR